MSQNKIMLSVLYTVLNVSGEETGFYISFMRQNALSQSRETTGYFFPDKRKNFVKMLNRITILYKLIISKVLFTIFHTEIM